MGADAQKFKKIIKYFSLLDNDSIGNWIIDHENDGTPEYPIQMPFVNYSKMVHHFIEDVYDFNENNKVFELTHYGEILERDGLKWGQNLLLILLVLAWMIKALLLRYREMSLCQD